MVYLLLVIGLVLIYFSLKSDKNSGKKNFSTILQNKIDAKDIESIMEQMKYLSDRVENIEASLLLNEDKLYYNNVNEDSFVVDDEISTSIQDGKELEVIQDSQEIKYIDANSQLSEKETLNNILYKLYDEGKTVEEISSITKTGKGEILLRLGLRKQKL